MRRIKFLLLLILFFVVNFLPFFNRVVEAAPANLLLSPSSGEYVQGASISTRVMVNSGGAPGINAAEGIIKFDPEFLSVSSISKASSVFTLWVTEPTHSNTAGTIKFGGGLPGAYTGNSGLIMTINFSIKKAGNTSLSFTSGIVLAYGPTGDEVTGNLGTASYTITEPKEPEPKPEKPTPVRPEPTPTQPVRGILPPRPEIDSSTHKDENTWYSNSKPEFSWRMLADLTGMSYDISNKAVDDPGNTSDGIVETKRFEDIKDGEWYLHLKYQNNVGWGQVGTKKFLVDTTPPTLRGLKIDNGGDSNNPSPYLVFDASDETSGIDYFELVKGEEVKKIELSMISDGKYKIDKRYPGEHIFDFLVYDKAKNIASSSIKFFIEPLRSPIISDIPKTIKTNQELIIRGKSFYPKADINLSIGTSDKDAKIYVTKTDEEGNWAYFHKDQLQKGNYEVSAWISDDRGAESYRTAKNIIVVIEPSIIESYGLFIILFLLLVIFILASYIWFIKHKFGEERLRISRETNEAKLKLGEIFTALREEVDELMELADKKVGLSESEKRVKDKLQDALDISEEFIGKEIEDVNKEIHLKIKK